MSLLVYLCLLSDIMPELNRLQQKKANVLSLFLYMHTHTRLNSIFDLRLTQTTSVSFPALKDDYNKHLEVT